MLDPDADPSAPASPGAAPPGFAAVPARLRGHLPALDGVRGVAILLVLVHNVAGTDASGRVLVLFDTVIRAGWFGVHLFFALSGFLITGILLDAKGARGYLRGFFVRRVLRIVPLYYLTLAAYFVVVPLVTDAPWIRDLLAHDRPNQIWYWLYLSNWTDPAGHGATFLPHFWSLAVEEQFYLVWPVVVHAVSTRGLARLCVGLAAVALAVRVGVHVAGLSPAWAYQTTAARMDALTLGALAAVIARQPRWAAALWPHLRAIALALVAALAALAVASRGWSHDTALIETAGFSLLAVLFALVVFVAAVAPAIDRDGWTAGLARWLAAPVLRWFGKYSYGIYVFHMLIKRGLHDRFHDEFYAGGTAQRIALNLAFFALVSALSIAAAVGSWHLIEQRVLGLRPVLAPVGARADGAPRA